MDYGAVLQMIAHGFVVVGLFSSLTIFRRYETRTIAEMGGIRTSTICFDVLTFSISFSCSSYYFNFVESFTVLYSLSQINVWFALLGGMIILGAYYMLKMYQQVMLEKRNKTFKDVNFKEGFALVVIIAVLFFWDVSKTNYRLNHTKFGKYFNSLIELTVK
jgi:NADH-quinone oxidoreductase subunit M